MFTLHAFHPILKLGRIVKTCRSMQEFFSRLICEICPFHECFFTSPNPPPPHHNVYVSNRPSLRPASTLLRDFAYGYFNMGKSWILDLNECQEKHLLKQHMSLQKSSFCVCVLLTFLCNSHNNKQ